MPNLLCVDSSDQPCPDQNICFYGPPFISLLQTEYLVPPAVRAAAAEALTTLPTFLVKIKRTVKPCDREDSFLFNEWLKHLQFSGECITQGAASGNAITSLSPLKCSFLKQPCCTVFIFFFVRFCVCVLFLPKLSPKSLVCRCQVARRSRGIINSEHSSLCVEIKIYICYFLHFF